LHSKVLEFFYRCRVFVILDVLENDKNVLLLVLVLGGMFLATTLIIACPKLPSAVQNERQN